jgi:hypothetical protein
MNVHGNLMVQAGLFLEPTTDNNGRLNLTCADGLRFQGQFHRISEDEPLLLLHHSASRGKLGWLAITATTQCDPIDLTAPEPVRLRGSRPRCRLQVS